MASIKKDDKLIENKKVTYALAFAFICLIAFQAYTTIKKGKHKHNREIPISA